MKLRSLNHAEIRLLLLAQPPWRPLAPPTVPEAYFLDPLHGELQLSEGTAGPATSEPEPTEEASQLGQGEEGLGCWPVVRDPLFP